LSRKEVIRRLRDRGEPITLFGESEFDSFKRLRRSEVAEPESNKVWILILLIRLVFLHKEIYVSGF
jgi:hypothetical protein